MRLKFFIVTCSALIWVALYWLNIQMFPHFKEQLGVNWIFLPSGARLLLVLLFDWPAVLGLMLGSCLTGPLAYGDHYALILAAAVLSGGTPYLALLLIRTWPSYSRSLSNLTAARLLIYAVVFALMNSGCHQLLYLAFGVDTERTLPEAFFAMATGDFLGSLIVLGSISMILRLMTHFGQASNADTSG